MKATNSYPDVGVRDATESQSGSRGLQSKSGNLKLLWFSIAIASFFILLFLFSRFEIQLTIIGVFHELLILPMMAAPLVLLGILGKKLLREQNRTTANLLALIISLATTIFILQSFL